jgi:GDP-L-fucose synthase
MPTSMRTDSKIYLAGNRGLVGSAIERRLRAGGYASILTSDIRDFDLTDPRAADAFFAQHKPEFVFVAAAKVGGIKANDTYPADFIRINLQIQTNLIDAAHRHGAKKLLFLGSSCIYPKLAPQPMPESCLLTGPLEPTNEAYAIAKIAGLKLCEYYRKQHGVVYHAAMPTNLYGPGDNYHLQNSHVLPALIRKFHEAKEAGRAEVVAWGTGSPKREFLHVDELADACAFLLKRENPPDLINIGTGTDVTIRELTEVVAAVVGFPGRITWDATKPDGTPRKLMDVSRLTALGWRAKIGLREGVEKTYASYLAEKAAGTLRS